MGYCMNQRGSDILITTEQQKKAFKPVRKKLLDEVDEKGGGGSWKGGKKVESCYSWVNMSEIKRAKSLIDILNAFRWTPEIDDKGDIINVNFEGEKLGDDKILFDAIAPYVESGSYIEMIGEDDSLWRWIFKNKKCTEIGATITFEE